MKQAISPKKRSLGWRLASWLWKVPLIVLILGTGWLIFQQSWVYYTRTNIGFLAARIDALKHWIYLPAFYGHIAASPVILLLGLLQFSRYLRQHFTILHRIFGKIYIFLILSLSAPCGFAMAFWANGGWLGSLCFILLAIAWWFTTFWAFKFIKKGNIKAHKRWMIRSYVLTLSAVFLRFYSFLAAEYWGLSGATSYVWIAWLSWLPHLLLVEFYFLTKKRFTKSRK